jgi:hypothetical protein
VRDGVRRESVFEKTFDHVSHGLQVSEFSSHTGTILSGPQSDLVCQVHSLAIIRILDQATHHQIMSGGVVPHVLEARDQLPEK